MTTTSLPERDADVLADEIRALLAESERLRMPDQSASIAHAEQALGLAEQLPDYEHSPLYLDSHIELAAALQESGKFERALKIIMRASSMLEYHHDDQFAIRVHRVLATVQLSLGDYTQALASLHSAQQLAQQYGDRAIEAEILSNIGLAYGWLGMLDKGLESFQQALALSEQAPMRPASLVMLLGNTAYMYFLLNDLAQAQAYAERGLQIAREFQDLFVQVMTLGTLSEIALAHGDVQTAEEQLEEGRRITEGSNVPRLQLTNLRDWATFYTQTDQPERAISIYQAGLKLAEELSSKPVVEECLRGLSAIYEQQGDFVQALAHFRAATKVHKDINSERISYRIDIQKDAYRHELLRQEHKALAERNALLEQLIEERNQSLRLQQELLDDVARLSTPVLPLVPGVLVVPLVGSLDSERVMRMHEQVLDSVAQLKARVLLLDITGVPIVDTHVASALIMIVRAAQLLGCVVVMVGIRPEIAQSLVSLGVELGDIVTRASLSDGLYTALRTIGLQMAAR